MIDSLAPSLKEVLKERGIATKEAVNDFLCPSLDRLSSPDAFPQIEAAVGRLKAAIRSEEPIAIYADRDVDGLSGLAILLRTLRTLGGHVIWGSPLQGRGVERSVLQSLLDQKARIVIFVDCGAGEETELTWLAEQGIDVIVADHHRVQGALPKAFAWIHPKAAGPSIEAPAGCVMAFKLAQALWLSFLGTQDPERMDYFLFDHLDLLCLGILADRMPLTGENRIFVWHGLRRLARTRKTGLAALLRFFRLTPREGPVTVREATWQIIPLLNAAGRLRQPQWTANLLTTEDPWTARSCIDALIDLNTERRSAQQKSVDHFEKLIIEQCAVDTDPVLVAMAQGLEPSVTGLAAQAVVRRYGRPAFLFVDQGEEAVGSARGTPDVDLFAWVEEHRDLLVKFGGHQGAVGLTLRTRDFSLFRERLLSRGERPAAVGADVSLRAEARVILKDLDADWWKGLQQMEPFGPGFPCPVFEIGDVERIHPVNKRKQQGLILKSRSTELIAEGTRGLHGEGPWTVIGYPAALKAVGAPFKWMILEVCKKT